MRYQCHECLHTFEEFDILTESSGEEFAVCPYCKGFFDEIKYCKICGEAIPDTDLTSGVCDECIYEHSYDIELCHKLGDEGTDKVELNGFIASIFTPEQINEILWNRIKEINKMVNISCYEFIDADKSWFAEQLVKENNNGFLRYSRG